MVRFAPATNVGENCSGAKGVVLWDIAKDWKVNNAQKGFTLIEIAIVLVIVGFLMIGVAKAQELIQGSRVRALIAQQSDIRTAFFGFHDRYRALPGDYRAASANINCGAALCLDGDGDGRIQASNSSNGNSGNHNGNGNGNGNHGNGNNGNGNGNNGNNGNAGQSATIDEGLLAWTHLSAAGFLNGSFTLTSGAVSTPDDSNSPKNPYGAYLQILFDNTWGYSTDPALHHNIKTGNLIPAAILAEIDRKIDDGKPYTGAFQSQSMHRHL
jgi:prepilin-type N-terminal cleavage/methylation domain-containing protein